MDGASVFQIAKHGHGHTIHIARAELFKDRERIEQRLRGMLADPVACVDDRLTRRLGRDRRRTGFGMPQHDHIRVTFERADRIRQALALRHGRIFDFVNGDDRSAEPLHRRGE